MKNLVKSILISAAAVAMTVAVITPASADDHWHHHHGSSGWAYGAAGLATGLIVGSAIANQPRYYDQQQYYYDDEYAPPPRYYYGAPRRTYYVPVAGSLRPWTPAWSRYCYDRYMTFDGRTGTYIGNDGVRHFCVAG